MYMSKQETRFVTKVYYSIDSNRRGHDGFSICEIATIRPVFSDENAEYMLSFHQYGNDPQLYVILCDDVKKNINNE